jgi:hypothetical protein
MDSIPFESAVFENYTEKNYKVKVNVVGKGPKGFCFYEDEIVGENETSAIKELPTNSVVVFSVIKYSLSSIFNLKYFFAPLKGPFGNTLTSQKAPKIYKELPTLQPEQPEQQINQANEQLLSQEQNMQNNAQQQYSENYDYMPYQDQNMNNQYYPQNMEANMQYEQNNVQSNAQYTQNNMQNQEAYNQYMYQNNAQIGYQTQNNMIQNPYAQNIPKSNNQIKKKTGNPVFKTQGQIIDESGVLVQYAMINGDNYVIGLENRSNMKIKLQLSLLGLVIGNNGQSHAVFYSNPRERKIFNTKILPNYDYDQVAFEFQYA